MSAKVQSFPSSIFNFSFMICYMWTRICFLIKILFGINDCLSLCSITRLAKSCWAGSLLFLGWLWDAFREWCEAEQDLVSLEGFGLSEHFVCAMQKIQHSQHSVALVEPENQTQINITGSYWGYFALSLHSFLSPDNVTMGFLHHSPWQLCQSLGEPCAASLWCHHCLEIVALSSSCFSMAARSCGSTAHPWHCAHVLSRPACPGLWGRCAPAGTAVPPRVSQLCSNPCPGMWWQNCPLGWFCSRTDISRQHVWM